STLDLSVLLRQVIGAAMELTETEAASILLIDPHSGELRFEAITSAERSEMEGIVVPVEGSIAGWIVTHAAPLIVPDVTRDTRFFRAVDQRTTFVTRSLLGVPLRTREKTIGVLEAINKRHGSFRDEDVLALEALAAQAAVAIQNARLFQQSDLIAEMVHELRTPLASLTASCHLLQRPELPEDRRLEIVHTIQAETARLTQMTSDFLDLARLESGRARFRRELFNLPELIMECVGIVQPQAGERDLTMRVELADDLPRPEGDRGKIKQVLLNLLTNAVKYNCDFGHILVRARVQEQALHVEVEDSGRGIAPDDLPHVFEKFYRVTDAEGWTQGTGLGLPIAQKIVENHGGQLTVRSTPGEGTTFAFTLPLPAPAAAPIITRQPGQRLPRR
ncbi:MAG: GAF domain-containing sensor histidine kinase, partial [Chloroflexi bacterium]|nr:GAF domain-containing sensor histidine kinase [Chloroflexota bacterium]